jgi:peptidoglycan hydrolase CwlO-like protein
LLVIGHYLGQLEIRIIRNFNNLEMHSTLFKKILLFILIAALISPSYLGFAQMTTEQERTALEKELKELEEKIRQYDIDITKTEAEKQTLQYQINTLRNRINQLDLEIRRSNIIIKDLGLQITDTEDSIHKTSLKIDDLRKKLAVILQIIYEESQSSIIEVLFSADTLSDFFDNLMALESLNLKSQEFLGEIKSLKRTLEDQKLSLNSEKFDLEKTVQMQYTQIQQSQSARTEQEALLKMTESQYQQYLIEREVVEKEAAEIRRKLVDLIGARRDVSYEEYLEIAKEIGRITGIRPAFLLGIITQESALGRNVGQCYLQDITTGMGLKINTNQPWPRVMSTANIPYFVSVIDKLNQERGFNMSYQSTPLSCWIPICYLVGARSLTLTYNNISVDSAGNIKCPAGYAPYGFGGAMGPAQFIASTWKSVEQRIKNITGRTADPWDVYDALLGSAIHLTQDCGALSNETTAAACYFGGWGNRNSSYHISSYSKPVLSLAKCHQDFIDTQTMSAWCQGRILR